MQQGKDGEVEVGAVKLSYTKTKKVSKEAAQYVGSVLQKYLHQHYPKARVVARLCQIVDVFGGRIWTASPATKARMQDIVAACEEIARGWGGNSREAA
jgi:hypothetical protein